MTGGDLKTALQAYLQALKLRPAWWPYRQRLQQIHLLRGETDAAAQHRRAVERAVAAAERVRRFWWLEHDAAGEAFVARNKWSEAEREFIRATVFLPEDPVSYFNLANLYEHLSRPDEAVAAYQKVIEVAPDFAPAREHLHSLQTE